jgi:uncharacterized membrane protein
MKKSYVAAAAAVTVVAMVAVSLTVAGSLPADVRLPIHWGLNGRADGFSDRWTALLMPPGMVAGVSLLIWFLPSIEPRKEGLQRSQGLVLWAWIGLLLMGGAIELAVVSAALDWGLPGEPLILGAVGVMLAMIGNQLGKSRSMYTVGIRTPWTLASEEVWIRTHRLGGKLMMTAGALILLAALLPMPGAMLGLITLVAVGVAVAVPVVFSCLLWRREQAGQSSK